MTAAENDQAPHAESNAKRVVSAVEMLIDSPEALHRRGWEQRQTHDGNVDAACQAIISQQSNVSAIVGALSAAPAIIPGPGTAMAVLGGMLGEAILLLKLETELCMLLSAAHGFDVRLPHERQLAMLLASIGTFQSRHGDDVLLALGITSAEAIWNYAPREVSKLLLRVVGRVLVVGAARNGARTLLLAAPFVGMGVGAGMNKALTARVGKRAHVALVMRARAAERTG